VGPAPELNVGFCRFPSGRVRLGDHFTKVAVGYLVPQEILGAPQQDMCFF